MFYVYILKSLSKQRYYVGSTQDIEERLERHNQGREKSTKGYIPWELIYKESFLSRSEAINREREVKSFKGGKAFKKLIEDIK